MNIIRNVLTNILTAIYQPFLFASILSILILFLYLYAYHPVSSGKGWKQAWIAWLACFRSDPFFRRLFFLTFYVIMALFQTVLDRPFCLHPLAKLLRGWWIWETNSSGRIVFTTESFENLALFFPFTILLFWTMGEKILPRKTLGTILLTSARTTFLLSLSIELLQLILHLGTFQLSDLFYNTLGGVLGGVLYWIGCWRGKKRRKRNALKEDEVPLNL